MRAPLVVLFCLLVAHVAAADGEWRRTMDAVVESRHVRHGIEWSASSAGPAVYFTDDVWSISAAANLAVETGQPSELGASVAYASTIGSAINWSAKAAHCRFSGIAAGHPHETSELTLRLAIAAGPGRLGVAISREIERRADLGELSYEGEFALKSWGAFLNYRLYAGSVSAADVLPRSNPTVSDSYAYHGADLTLPYRIGGETVLTAGFHYAGARGARAIWSPIGSTSSLRFWFSLAASREF